MNKSTNVGLCVLLHKANLWCENKGEGGELSQITADRKCTQS